MILDLANEVMTELFPERVPERDEAMTPEESASLAAWQASPQGRAIYAALATHIAERLELDGGGKIITVGEGEGLLARELAALLPDVSILGTDICPKAIARARARHRAGNLRYEVAAAGEIVRFGPADAVICSFALHHFANARAALASMGSALAAGGRLYIHDLRRDADAGAYFRTIDRYVDAAFAVAPLFRASVHAAYTTVELAQMLAPHAGPDGVRAGPVRLGPRALEAYSARDPEAPFALPAILRDIEGLWQEGMVRRPE